MTSTQLDHVAKWNGQTTAYATFANWRELIDMGAFIDDHQTYSWQEALPFMVNGEAASYLMGNFAVAPMREGGLDDSKLDFYQFPRSTLMSPRAKMRQQIRSTSRRVRRTRTTQERSCSSCHLRMTRHDQRR